VRIKTVTFHGAHNYGAVLQAYALQQTLISLGYDNEIIDCRVDQESVFQSVKVSVARDNIAKIRNNLFRVLRYRAYKDRFDKFEKFINEDLSLTKRFHSFEELKRFPPEAEVYLAGSDQIWNTSRIVREMFFLRFGDSDIKRISYAASMGTYVIPPENQKLFGEFIRSFDKISVREKEASDYIESNYGIASLVHVDPVFLLKKAAWEEVSVECNINRKYILCYPLIFSSELNDYLRRLKHETGYHVVVVTTNPREKTQGDIYVRNAGPKQFLGLIRNAEIIVTTSFHGTAFSIVFEKQFIAFPVFNSTRITNILSLLGLKNRVFGNGDGISLEAIDYVEVNKKLDLERQRSLDFLKRAIEE